MAYPITRMRRLRRSEPLRRMVRETQLRTDDLIMPLFVQTGQGVKAPIASMPGQFRFSPDTIVEEAWAVRDAGVPAVLLFGIPDHKDALATCAYDDEGVVQRAVRAIKKAVPDLVVITDVCLCEYTSHGHCGQIVDGEVDNDSTLPLLARQALSHARAGADIVAPSDMMDGRVGHLRGALDSGGFDHLPILSYAAKYASAFYGPFRDAAESAPQFGDRRGYQMDPPNVREALREVALDVAEGADIVMVKPALAYLDVIAAVRRAFDVPVAAYQVSGEYSMILAAAERGWVDGTRAALETLTAIKRAGADLILTYFARKVAPLIR